MGMLHVMHVTTQVVNHAVFGKPQGAVPSLLAEIARKRQDIDLEPRASIVQLIVAFATTRIIGVTLRVS